MSIPKSYTQLDWRWLLTVLLVIITVNQTADLIELLHNNQTNKSDLAELNHIRYGLLNADQWVEKTTTILEKKIDEYELSDQNKAELRRTLEHLLDSMIVEVDQLIREKNLSGNDSWWEKLLGQFQQLVTDILVDVQSFRSRVPEFTDLIFAELSKPDSKANIKNFLHEKLRDFTDNSFNRTDYSPLNAIIGQHGCGNLENCRIQLTQEIGAQNTLAAQQALGVLALTVSIFGLGMIRQSQPNPKRVMMLGLTCVVLLWGGISTPMIEIDAKVSELTFHLLGESVVFDNQVLYFQSKSITDVVAILTATGKADMILVGVLVSVFSIGFPVAKILASLFYYYDMGGLRYNSVVQFFALKSSKWSMADVMVVALFMAYIGFSGLISSQLSYLDQASRHVKVLTTDGTSLQAGFFLFLGFCVASLVLSGLLERMVTHNGYLATTKRSVGNGN